MSSTPVKNNHAERSVYVVQPLIPSILRGKINFSIIAFLIVVTVEFKLPCRPWGIHTCNIRFASSVTDDGDAIAVKLGSAGLSLASYGDSGPTRVSFTHSNYSHNKSKQPYGPVSKALAQHMMGMVLGA